MNIFFQYYDAGRQPTTCIEGFHRVTFVSNFDVNVEIGGHFGDQEHIMAIEATVTLSASCIRCIIWCCTRAHYIKVE